ncbi:peptidase S66 family protein [Arthrobacter sp. EpRS66]|nr:peptidase S66 family protein [Arthrobacter sp. EpRS66]
MKIRYPRPLLPGDQIGVTSPSSGVPEELIGRLNFAVEELRAKGFDVVIGRCMEGSSHISAPAKERADELMRMLVDPKIRAVVPPWGGVTVIDIIDLLDFDALAEAEPTWFVGFSDISTLLTPITLRTGMATLHGSNLMDTPYQVPEALKSWVEIASLPAGSSFRQSSPGLYRANDWDDWEVDPKATEHQWNGSGRWERLDSGRGAVHATGRLIGGCIETLANLTGTGNLDSQALRQDDDDALIVYVEASSVEATTICRHLHGLRMAGLFDGAQAVLIGRTSAPDSPTLTQHEAVVDALGMLDIPLIGNVECGHVPPQLPIVNGALGRVVFNDAEQYLEQHLL